MRIGTRGILEIVALIISLAFVCSLIYNFAYFWALGIPLSDTPLSTIDIVNTAIIWAPAFILLIVIYLAVIAFLVLLVNVSEVEGKKYDLWRKISPRTFWLLFFIGLISIGIVILFLIFGQTLLPPLIFFAAVMNIWFNLNMWLMDRDKDKSKIKILLRILIIFVPIFLFGFFWVGYSGSLSQLFQKNYDSIVYTKDNVQGFEAVFIRSLDDGVYVKKVNDKNLTFLPWSEVKRLDRQYKKRIFHGALCAFMSNTTYSVLHHLCSQTVLDQELVSESQKKSSQ